MRTICNITVSHRRNDSRIFQRQCCLESQHYETHLLVTDNERSELQRGIHIHGIRLSRFMRSFRIFLVYKAYQKAKTLEVDTYVLHDPELLLIALLLKKKGKCIIWDCHEYYRLQTHANPSRLYRTLISFYMTVVETCVIPRLDGIMAANPGIAKLLKRKYAKSIFVLNNYATIRQFKNVQFPNFEHVRCVLYTGGFTNGILNAVHALTLCKNDIKFILRVKEGFRLIDDRSLLFNTRCSFEVDYEKNASFEQVQLLHRKCFAGFIMHENSFGDLPVSSNKCYEYMAQGLPVIVIGGSSSKYYKNLVYNNGYPLGLCVNSDPQAIADAIDYLYENKEVARTMGMNGRKAFETKYNFESEADGFLKFLEEVSQSKNQNK